MKSKKFRTIITQLFVFIFLFGLALWFADEIKDNEAAQHLVRNFGYWGVFILAVVSGFNVIVPVPAMSFLPVFLAAGLSTGMIVVVVSIGMTMGDGVGYILGKLGREAISVKKRPRWLNRFETLVNQYRFGLPVFVFLYAAFIPLPNELVVIPAAATGEKWWAILVPVLFGNIIMNVLFALGITSLFL
jgi:membrane protein YqaA with SNARE-associated domain